MASISVVEGRAILEQKGYEQAPGCNNSKFEVWLNNQGFPEMIPYIGRDQQFFDKEVIEEIVARSY